MLPVASIVSLVVSARMQSSVSAAKPMKAPAQSMPSKESIESPRQELEGDLLRDRPVDKPRH